jgi:hypothetical protein
LCELWPANDGRKGSPAQWTHSVAFTGEQKSWTNSLSSNPLASDSVPWQWAVSALVLPARDRDPHEIRSLSASARVAAIGNSEDVLTNSKAFSGFLIEPSPRSLLQTRLSLRPPIGSARWFLAYWAAFGQALVVTSVGGTSRDVAGGRVGPRRQLTVDR